MRLRGQRLSLWLLFMLAGWPVAVQDVLAQEMRFFTIATGGVSGTYYPVGGLIADVISQPPGARSCDRGGTCGVPGLVAIASSSEGSIANVQAIADGSANSGFVQSDVAFDAFHGQGSFAENGPVDDLRLIASLYVEHTHIVAKDATAFEDLFGKRLSIDVAGSGTQRVAELVVEAHDMTLADFELRQVRPGQAVRQMLDQQLDGYIVVAGFPTPSVTEATGSLGGLLLPMSKPVIDRLIAKNPFFSATFIPPGTYPNQISVVPTIGVVAQWLTSAETGDELVYAITRSLWHPTARQLLDNGHRRGRSIRLASALDGAGIPLHPGAERFYREQNILPEQTAGSAERDD